MHTYEVLLGKSWQAETKDQAVPEFAQLIPHLQAVEQAAGSIVEIAGELILQQLELPIDPWLSRLKRVMRAAALCHDLGKANECFQQMVTGALSPRQQPARHELLSALMLEDKDSPVREWALEMLRGSDGQGEADLLLDCVIGAVAGHHVKLDKDWEKAALALHGGCGRTAFRMMLTHPEMQKLFGKRLVEKEQGYSLIADEPNFIGAHRTPFNRNSRRWREKLKDDVAWWRFAAAVKALLMAADVAGSAMLPAGEDIPSWVRATLSQRITAEQMQEVVSVRLKGYGPRPFQEAIGESTARVTLVEAGCGSGKTAAAYMWAAHHAHGKKLFFCYPTTGTATEGFLGYVHENDIEAALIHSRAGVDLENVARVKCDEEAEDHLLRIDSLRAWGPQVIVCTADTVLALVRNNRRGLYNSPAIFSGAFVFDEIHAYDSRMFVGMLALIKALPAASFLLMSASLPRSRKDFLLSQFADAVMIPPPHELEDIPRYEFQMLANETEAYRQAQAAATRGEKVLWVCNTVRKAQEIYRELCQLGVAVRNYHSRFKYEDRVRQHRTVIDAFKPERTGTGLVAVTTQVAEMSLDLDADLLITDTAPISALIQRLGRLNRRVTPQHCGTPRKALFLIPVPKKSLPYEEAELTLARKWLETLIELRRPLSQDDLSQHFLLLTPAEESQPDLRTEWLDSGWHAMPGTVREPDCSVSVILSEDAEACRRGNRMETVRRAIPMSYDKRMQDWEEWKGSLIAPAGAIEYSTETGATWLKK